jgi:hypothetical protein
MFHAGAGWHLAAHNASEPVALAVTERGDKPVNDRPLGTQVFRLLDAMAYSPAHKGKKMSVKGLLIRLPRAADDDPATETIAPTAASDETCALVAFIFHSRRRRGAENLRRPQCGGAMCWMIRRREGSQYRALREVPSRRPER